MNAGFVTGRVFVGDGRTPVSRGEVALTAIIGSQQIAYEGQRKNYASGNIGNDGRFVVPFSWSGAEFGTDMSVLRMKLYADMQGTPSRTQPFVVLAHNRVEIPAYIFENFSARLGLTLGDVQSAPGLAAFAKDLIEAYRKIKATPLPSVEWMSTEGKLMVGHANIIL